EPVVPVVPGPEVDPLRDLRLDDQLAVPLAGEVDHGGLSGDETGREGGERRREAGIPPLPQPLVGGVEVVGGGAPGEGAGPVLRTPRVRGLGARAPAATLGVAEGTEGID